MIDRRGFRSAYRAAMDRTDVVASLAVTLDGYIARPDGSVDFLPNEMPTEFDFESFTDEVGALIMGRATYEQQLEWGWTWGDRPAMVLTTRTDLAVVEGGDITFAAMPTAEAIRSFGASTPGRLWVFGGGRVVTDGLVGGAIDELDITVMPIAIGEGLPLFTAPYDRPPRSVVATPYSNGAVRLVYDTRS